MVQFKGKYIYLSMSKDKMKFVGSIVKKNYI